MTLPLYSTLYNGRPSDHSLHLLPGTTIMSSNNTTCEALFQRGRKRPSAWFTGGDALTVDTAATYKRQKSPLPRSPRSWQDFLPGQAADDPNGLRSPNTLGQVSNTGLNASDVFPAWHSPSTLNLPTTSSSEQVELQGAGGVNQGRTESHENLLAW